MRKLIIIMFSLLLSTPTISSQLVAGTLNTETEEKTDISSDDILLGKRKAYWKILGRRIPSNLRYLTDADVIIIISGCALTILAFTLLISSYMSKDSWHDGYDEGVYSKIIELAKIRYIANDDVCIASVPEEVWNQLHDEFTMRSWFSKRIIKIKRWLSRKLHNRTSSDD